MRVGNVEASEGEALPRCESSEAQPFVERRVVELRIEDDAARRCWLGRDTVSTPEECEIRRDEVPVAGLEVDRASPGDEAAVGRRQSHHVRHRVRPGERQGCAVLPEPPSGLERDPALITDAPMGHCHACDARICRRGESLRPAFSYPYIYARSPLRA